MKFSYYSATTIPQNIVGQQIPLGNIPISFINESGASDIPILFSVVESTESAIQNVITGVDSVTTTSTENTVFLVANQKVTYNIIKSSGTWGVMSLSPVYAFASIVSTVGDTVTIEFDASVASSGDYSSVDYDDEDYLTSGINGFVGSYEIQLLEDSIDVGTFNVEIFPTVQIRQICLDNVLNFAWLNRSGGWNSFALECKYVKGFSIGRQKTYKTASDVIRNNELDEVYQTYSLIAEGLTTFELDLLSSLRTSIQAYLYNENSLSFDIPIIIDTRSFETYGNRQRQPDRNMSFNFRIATQEVIQTQ